MYYHIHSTLVQLAKPTGVEVEGL